MYLALSAVLLRVRHISALCLCFALSCLATWRMPARRSHLILAYSLRSFDSTALTRWCCTLSFVLVLEPSAPERSTGGAGCTCSEQVQMCSERVQMLEVVKFYRPCIVHKEARKAVSKCILGAQCLLLITKKKRTHFARRCPKVLIFVCSYWAATRAWLAGCVSSGCFIRCPKKWLFWYLSHRKKKCFSLAYVSS